MIKDKILERMVALASRGPDGEVIRGITTIEMNAEIENQKIIAEKLLKPRDRAIELFAAYNLDFILYASGVVGKEGRVYPISSHEYYNNPNLVFEGFVSRVREFLFSKDYEEDLVGCSQGLSKDIFLLIDGTPHFEKIKNILCHKLSQDYLTSKSINMNRARVFGDAQKFYREMGICMPEQVRVPPFPAEIDKGTINLIIEQNFFEEQEKNQIPLLKASNNMLSPGGYLVFKEFRFDVFKLIQKQMKCNLEGYSKKPLPPLKNHGFWLIYQKPE